MTNSLKLPLLISISLAINFALLVFYYTPSPKALVGDENYYDQTALQISAGQNIPYDLRWPPLYPEFISAVFAVFHAQRIIYVQIVQVVLWIINALLFERIVYKLTGSRTSSGIALTLFLLSPELIVFTHYLWPETIHLFFWILSLWLLICGPRGWLGAALAGVLFGLAMLTKSLLAPFVPVVAIFVFLLDTPLDTKKRLLNAALVLILAIAVTLPTMIYNKVTRDAFTVADSSVFNIWVGLNDVSTTDNQNEIVDAETVAYLRSGPDLQTRNAIYTGKIIDKIEMLGLGGTLLKQIGKQYFRLFDVQSFFTTQLPGGGRQAYSTSSVFLINLLKVYSYSVYGFILIAGMVGLCFMRLRPLGWPHLFALFILYNLGIFLLLHVTTRYVLQFLPMLIFFASIWLDRLIHLGKPGATLQGFSFTKLRLGLAVFTCIAMSFVVYYNLIWRQFLG